MKKEKWKDFAKETFSFKKSLIWSIPSIILVILVSIQAVIFVDKTYEQTQTVVVESVASVAKGYAIELESELNKLAAQAKPMASLLKSVSDLDKDTIANSLVSMKENTAAYQVLYAKLDGKAIAEDGTTITIIDEVYFQKDGIDATAITYTAYERITGNSAIVISVPVKKEGQVNGYLLLYYPTNQFETLFSSSAFSKTAFYALSDEHGFIFSLDGYPSLLVQGKENLFETLEKATFKKNDRKEFYTHFTHRTEGYTRASLKNEEKWLYYEPVEDTNIMIIMGVDDGYLRKQLVKKMDPTYSFVGCLLGCIFIYILVMFAMFITHRVKRKKLAEREYDEKTGLFTKEAATHKITEYIENQPDSLAALFAIDIDGFAEINEKQGRVFGDSILKDLGDALKNKFREYDIISRFDGDQFVVFLKYFPNEELLRREAGHVAAAFCDVTFEKNNYEISTSIGVSIFPKDGKNVDELHQRASEALEIAKSMGMDQMVYYEEIMPEDAFL